MSHYTVRRSLQDRTCSGCGCTIYAGQDFALVTYPPSAQQGAEGYAHWVRRFYCVGCDSGAAAQEGDRT